MFCRQCGSEISNEAKVLQLLRNKNCCAKSAKGRSDNCLDAYKPAGGKMTLQPTRSPQSLYLIAPKQTARAAAQNEKDDESGEAHRGCDTSKQTAEGTANAPRSQQPESSCCTKQKALSSSYADDPTCRSGTGPGNFRGLRCVPRIQRRLAALSSRAGGKNHISKQFGGIRWRHHHRQNNG